MIDEIEEVFGLSDEVEIEGKKYKVKPLKIDDYLEFIREFLEIGAAIYKSRPDFSWEKFEVKDIGIFLPYLEKIKKILARSIDSEEEVIGKLDAVKFSELLVKFLKVNRIGEIVRNFQLAKSLLQVKKEGLAV